MGKDIVEGEVIISKDKKTKRTKSIYEGLDGSTVTVYQAGTAYGSIKNEHLKYFSDSDF